MKDVLCKYLVLPLLCVAQPASAKVGAVNYSATAPTLENAVNFVVTMMGYVVNIVYAVAAIVAIISALQIYIKMQHQEQQITQQIVALIGSILFIIGASILMPAFFGWQDVRI